MFKESLYRLPARVESQRWGSIVDSVWDCGGSPDFGRAVAWHAVATRRTVAAVALKAAGAVLVYDFEEDSGDWRQWRQPTPFTAHSPESFPGPAWLRARPGGRVLCRRSLSGAERLVKDQNGILTPWIAGDSALADIERFPEIRWLILSGQGITNAGLWHLEGLTRLEKLDLGNEDHG